MDKTRAFGLLTFSTYLPLPILGIMVIFGVMGKLFRVGWLESAPDVLLIPMLILYYISLIMGAIYGYRKKEEGVYLMAMFGLGAWTIGLLLNIYTSFSQQVMYAINILFIVSFLTLHLLQYKATKKWESRLHGAKQ
jgi:hypothetical protein